jgi:hypothetical protein
MKSKSKFDPKVIQQFFMDHTEKLVIGLVATLFLFFVYQSTLLDHYKKTPEELQQATSNASAKILNGPATKTAPKETPITPYADMIDQFKQPIDPGAYPTPVGMFWKADPRLRLRESPEVLAAEQLRAIPGRGAVAEVNGTRGLRWIVVTGLVPYKKQLAEYQAKFASATGYDPVKDMPRYKGYFVQRAEVVAGVAGEPKWKFMMFPPVDANDPIAKMGNQLAEEVADPRFVLPTLTSPLPLITGATWGTEVVCPPQIPVVER